MKDLIIDDFPSNEGAKKYFEETIKKRIKESNCKIIVSPKIKISELKNR